MLVIVFGAVSKLTRQSQQQTGDKLEARTASTVAAEMVVQFMSAYVTHNQCLHLLDFFLSLLSKDSNFNKNNKSFYREGSPFQKQIN